MTKKRPHRGPWQAICAAEVSATRAINMALGWCSDPCTRDELLLAQELLQEVRHAALTLCDETATTHEKNEAITRLEYAINHAGQEK